VRYAHVITEANAARESKRAVPSDSGKLNYVELIDYIIAVNKIDIVELA